MSPYPDDWNDDWEDGEDCANCSGEGYVSHCFREFACMHPDMGCDDCMRRCDWCNPAPKKSVNEVNALGQVLAKALSENGHG